jgi:hypothetical protein
MSITFIEGLCTNHILYWRMKCSSYGNWFVAVLLIHPFKLTSWTFGTSCLSHFIPVGDISMLLAHFIAFECAITGRKCFCTLKGCATCDQVAHSQIPHGVPLLTLFIISQSKHFFGCSLQMPTRLGNIQGLKEARLIYWCRMAWLGSPLWSQFSILMSPPSRLALWKSNYVFGSAMWLSSTRIVNFWSIQGGCRLTSD